MKNFVPAVALAFCVLHPDLPAAAVSLDPATNVVTDSHDPVPIFRTVQ